MNKHPNPTRPSHGVLSAHPVTTRYAFLAGVLPLLLALFGAGPASAQLPYQIIHQTNSTWSYHTNKTDPAYVPADAWTAYAFDDSTWPTGKGYFGFESTPASTYNPGASPAPRNCNCFQGTYITPAGSGGGVSSYFRTHFNWTNAALGDVTLRFTNWVDDSVVVYLNGVELFSFNMPATRPIAWNDALSGFPANPLGEGIDIVTNVFANSLQPGDNVLAVQLNQQGTGSSDDVFTMAMWAAALPTGLAITLNPTNRTIANAHPVTLSAGASGTNPRYQWYKNPSSPVAVPGATSSNLVFTNAVIADTGDYFVIATNFVNAVTSQVAHLEVVTDTNGPVLLRVKGDETFQHIVLTWDEVVEQGAAIELSNYTITDPGGNQFNPDSVTYNGSSVTLNVPLLIPDTNYSIEVDFQADQANNYTLPVGSPVNDPNGIVTNFNSWVIAPGFTHFQAYLSLPNNQSISQFKAMPIYPNGQSFGFYTNVLAWPQSLPGNGYEQYAMRFSGLFIAPEAGTYKFNPDHDDDVEVSLWTGVNTNGTAFTPFTEVCCNDFAAGATMDVNLNAGQTYYYELIVREFGGGDHAGLAVVLPSGPTNAPVSPQNMAVAFDPDLIPNFGISQQPQNQTVQANHAATFTVAATNTGGSVSYQWQLNAGSGFTNVPGAVGASYTTPYQPLANNGNTYRALVSVPGRTLTSSAATLFVVADTNAPHVLSVHGNRDLNRITVFFDEAMDAGSATEVSNYSMTDAGNNPVPLGTATISADLKSVSITSDPQTIGGTYTLNVSGVSDVAGNPITPTNVSFRAWLLSRGFVLFEAYDTGGGNTVSILTSHPSYPNSPRDVAYMTSFDSRNAYPNDSHEGYGARISGYFLAPSTSNYIFYIRSDDSSEFWMNTNTVNSTDPAGRVKLQEETSCCNVFSLHPTTNPPPSLVGGQAYYLELLWKEGTGGDFGQVAFKHTGNPVNPDTLLGIAGTFLATLADPVGASLSITQQPASVTVQTNQTTNFTVGATGTISSGPAPLAYQWQRNVGGTFVDIAGASSATYVTGPLQLADNGAQFRALVFIPGATATSSVATVTVTGGQPTQPALSFSSSGGSVNFTWTDTNAHLQVAVSLAPPVRWIDVTAPGVTNYTATPANEFNVILNSAQENVATNHSPGTGIGTVTLSNNVLKVNVTYTNLMNNRTADHFHAPAPRGANASVVYDLGGISAGTTSGSVVGDVTLTDGKYQGKNIAAQIQDIRNGLWYMNIHSLFATGGEIRSQVDPGTRFYRLVSP